MYILIRATTFIVYKIKITKTECNDTNSKILSISDNIYLQNCL